MASGNVSSQSGCRLNCLLCLQDIKNPRVLPCLHSFCEKCLGDYIVSNVRNPSANIVCPVCKETWSPPSRKVPIDQWASSFSLNDIFVSIMKLEEEREYSSKLVDLCTFGDDEVNANSWCPKLSAACFRHRSRNASGKTQNTVPIEEMDTSSTFSLKYNQHCICDRGHAVEMFCVDHKQMCCNVCSNTVHHGCKEMRDLEKTGKEFASGNMTANVLKDVEKIRRIIHQFQNIRQTNATTFQSDYDKCIKDMDDICNEIKQQVDIFQSSFRKTAKEIHEKVISSHRKQQENLLRFSTNVENSNHVLNVFNTHGDPKQKFTAYDTVISQLNSHYVQLKTELGAEQDVRLNLEVNKGFQELKKMTTTLGKINTSSATSTSANNFAESVDDILKSMATSTQLNSVVCAAQIARSDLLFRGFTHIRSVTQREVTGGKYIAWFTGGTFLHNGHLLMADFYNLRLVEFDTEHKMLAQYKLDGNPKDVTSREQDVYVSVMRGRNMFIYQCSMDGGLTVVRQITAPDDTWGLAVSQDGTIVVGTPNSVQVLSPSGKPVHSIQESGCHWSYVAVSGTSMPMFYHRYRDAVVCRSLQDGKQLYTYRHDNMVDVRGMCVGDTDVLYVCCVDSGNVHEISRDGKSGLVLLDKVHGITYPQAVLYNPHADQLIVTSISGGDPIMAVYQLK